MAEVVWPKSLENQAQNVRAPPTLTALYAHIADRATDPIKSPALGLNEKEIQTTNSKTSDKPSH
jgi:hypothetical protein